MSQQKAELELNRYNEKLGVPYIYRNYVYMSWPELFGDGAGPFKGIATQAMTWFRMEAWICTLSNQGVIFCKGRVVEVGELSITVTRKR